MTGRYPSFFPRRADNGVRNMVFSAAVRQGPFRVIFPAMTSSLVTGILSGQSISGTGSTTSFSSTYTSTSAVMAPWGRNLQASCAAGTTTTNIYVRGADYLGQRIYRQIALNSSALVVDTVAFKFVDEVDWDNAGSGVTLNLGWGNKLGLPFKLMGGIVSEIADNAPATAGSVTAGLINTTTTATATSADVRGTYTPNTAPTSAHTYELSYQADDTNLHGIAQFYQ